MFLYTLSYNISPYTFILRYSPKKFLCNILIIHVVSQMGILIVFSAILVVFKAISAAAMLELLKICAFWDSNSAFSSRWNYNMPVNSFLESFAHVLSSFYLNIIFLKIHKYSVATEASVPLHHDMATPVSWNCRFLFLFMY